MEYIFYLMGLSLILLGFLIVKAPMLLSGYNMLSKEVRDKIDTPKMTRSIRTVMIWMGVIIIAGTFILNLLGLSVWIPLLLLFTILGGIIPIYMIQHKYMKHISKKEMYSNKNKIYKYSGYIAIIITVVVFGHSIYTGIPADISTNNNQLEIKGSYGLTLPKEDITKVELRDHLPKSIIRTNGLSFVKYQKGHFRFEELGSVILFINSFEGPYLIVYSKNHNPIIINRADPEETKRLYQSLQ